MNLKKYIDFTLLKYLTIFYTVCVLLNLSKKVYWKLNGFSFYKDLSWFELLSYNVFLDWIVVLLFMLFISYLTKLMFEKWGAKEWKKIIGVHLFFSFFIGYFIFFTSSMIIFLIGEISFAGAMSNVTFEHFIRVVELNFLVYFSMIGIINVYYYIKKVKNIELQTTQLQAHLATTKLNMLKSQLHPHFIFNTLNSISSLIEIDKEKSQNLIADFSDLFRDILEYKDENLIPLLRELQLLEKYVDIILVRFSDHLVIKKDIEAGLDTKLVPTMLLQPIVENAIKHGYSYDKTELTVVIRIYEKSKQLCIEIENNGTPLDKSFKQLLKNGTGLKNTFDRLTTLYEDDFKFIVKNKKDNSGVYTVIRIPLME